MTEQEYIDCRDLATIRCAIDILSRMHPGNETVIQAMGLLSKRHAELEEIVVCEVDNA